MLALIIIGCIILFFAFILSLKAKITIEYSGELSVFLQVLFIKIKLYPKRDKKSGPHSMSKKRAARIKKKAEQKKPIFSIKILRKKQKTDTTVVHGKTTLSELLDTINTVKDIVGEIAKTFFGHLRIDLARLHITVASDDAATTAIYYGLVCDALTHLLPVLESTKGFKTPKAQDISVRADYLSEHITADVKISMSLRVWHVLHTLITAIKKVMPFMEPQQTSQSK